MFPVPYSVDEELYTLIKIVANGKKGGEGGLCRLSLFCEDTNKGIQNGDQNIFLALFIQTTPLLIWFWR